MTIVEIKHEFHLTIIKILGIQDCILKFEGSTFVLRKLCFK